MTNPRPAAHPHHIEIAQRKETHRYPLKMLTESESWYPHLGVICSSGFVSHHERFVMKGYAARAQASWSDSPRVISTSSTTYDRNSELACHTYTIISELCSGIWWVWEESIGTGLLIPSLLGRPNGKEKRKKRGRMRCLLLRGVISGYWKSYNLAILAVLG